ncbi:MAG: alpha-1,2-fucosyltransferase [Candidatus Falkowbacteria bacterium]
MIVIKLSGGLGNQMFQYAFGRALSLRYKQTLILDGSSYSKNNNNTKRKYLLNSFDIKAKHFSNRLLSGMFIFINSIFRLFLGKDIIVKEVLFYKYDNEIVANKNKINYFDGFWQSYKYFSEYKNIIASDFTIRSNNKSFKEIDDLIVNTNSVSIHVRRGDYVGNKDYEVCSADYYQAAINFFEEKYPDSVFYIFSDDVSWASDNLKFKNRSEFVSDRGLSDAEELSVMSHCKHNIISNSSFSWWAAWLNNNVNKKVIMPYKWSNADDLQFLPDLLPKEWVIIK